MEWSIYHWVLLFVVPYVVFAAAGLLLWKRWHTVATGMVALGFAAALIGQVAVFWVGLKSYSAAHHQIGTPRFVFPWLTHYVGAYGFWTAAVGLLWHAIRKR